MPEDTSFTVVLLYPDYLAEEDYGSDTYTGTVSAPDFRAAAKAVQQMAYDETGPESVKDPEDFKPLLVILGHVEIFADARSF